LFHTDAYSTLDVFNDYVLYDLTLTLTLTLLYNAAVQEPIRIPSATVTIADDAEDDASSMLVTKLMQTEASIGNSHSSQGSRQIVASAATVAAAVASVKTHTDGMIQRGDSAVTDRSTHRENAADNLHQLSLYVCALDCTPPLISSISLPNVIKSD